MAISLDIDPQQSSGDGDRLSFYEANGGDLEELFHALGRSDEWRDNPLDLLPYTQAKWVGQDHGKTAEKDHFTPEQESAAMVVLTRMGLAGEVAVPVGEFDQAIIIGGLMRANRRRMEFLKKAIIQGDLNTEEIIFWGGERAREARDDDEIAKMDLTSLSSNAWVSNVLKREGQAGRKGFDTETEVGRLAFVETFGPNPRLIDFRVRESSSAKPELSSYTFASDLHPRFTIMHGKSVARPNGPARHTTASCAHEWLDDHAPDDGANVLLVAGNPHILRGDREVRDITESRGRGDINLTSAGTSANAGASIQIYLGEIGRLLYMDTLQ